MEDHTEGTKRRKFFIEIILLYSTQEHTNKLMWVVYTPFLSHPIMGWNKKKLCRYSNWCFRVSLCVYV